MARYHIFLDFFSYRKYRYAMRFSFAHILHAVVLLAFVTVGISPACASFSGKSHFIEICTSDGSLRTVKVSSEYASADIGKQDNETQPKTRLKSDCGFCFVQTHFDGVSLDVFDLSSLSYNVQAIEGLRYSLTVDKPFKSFNSQGPPALFF